MPLLRDKLNFYSFDSIDKIVDSGEVVIVNDGNTTSSGTNTGPQTAKIVSLSIPNPYGRAALIRARWSIDGGSNWQGLESRLLYSFTITLTDIPVTSSPLKALQSAVSVGSNNTNIEFRTANGQHGNQSKLSTQGNVGYTPVSQTYRIQYWLYERE